LPEIGNFEKVVVDIERITHGDVLYDHVNSGIQRFVRDRLREKALEIAASKRGSVILSVLNNGHSEIAVFV